MLLYSTKNKDHKVSLEEAVFKGLPPDNGLYMPVSIPTMDAKFFDNIQNLSIAEIAYEVCATLFKGYISNEDTRRIVNEAVTFDAPLVNVHDNIYSLELYHGPTLAFKDFGARFMAKLMAHFLKNQNKEIHILVATSGDTGGAVANGFYNTKGIKVTILYPSGKVSNLQEKQLTTLGGNIKALEIDGTFDDCQSLVKQAFLDPELNKKQNFSSANSINIARLIPQSFYYFNTYARLKHLGKPLVFSVPSGNFGNICAGLIANKMGLPVSKFIASVNSNDTFIQFLKTGNFNPKPSVPTLSNAMDVGNPSNFARIFELFGQNHEAVSKVIVGNSYSDTITKITIRDVYNKTGYLLDPHGAVGYLGLTDYIKQSNTDAVGVFLHTAHPAKFIDSYDEDLKQKIKIPIELSSIEFKEKQSTKLSKDFSNFKEYLMAN
ncbi:MAG: threonine synthase [Bacteroidota bacterium]|nr:threonine synthase [Bacteroidota bacterium]